MLVSRCFLGAGGPLLQVGAVPLDRPRWGPCSNALVGWCNQAQLGGRRPGLLRMPGRWRVAAASRRRAARPSPQGTCGEALACEGGDAWPRALALVRVAPWRGAKAEVWRRRLWANPFVWATFMWAGGATTKSSTTSTTNTINCTRANDNNNTTTIPHHRHAHHPTTLIHGCLRSPRLSAQTMM